jgi:hypothetical protein
MENANFIIGKIWNNFGLFTSDEAGISHFNTGAWSLLFTSYTIVLIIMAVAYIIHWLPTGTKDTIQNSFIKLPMSMQMIVTVLAGFLIYQAVSADFTPFIYFQF